MKKKIIAFTAVLVVSLFALSACTTYPIVDRIRDYDKEEGTELVKGTEEPLNALLTGAKEENGTLFLAEEYKTTDDLIALLKEEYGTAESQEMIDALITTVDGKLAFKSDAYYPTLYHEAVSYTHLDVYKRQVPSRMVF